MVSTVFVAAEYSCDSQLPWSFDVCVWQPFSHVDTGKKDHDVSLSLSGPTHCH